MVLAMMYLHQFDKNLAVGSEDRVQFFSELYDSGDLEN